MISFHSFCDELLKIAALNTRTLLPAAYHAAEELSSLAPKKNFITHSMRMSSPQSLLHINAEPLAAVSALNVPRSAPVPLGATVRPVHAAA
jgi:hypothetical protein